MILRYLSIILVPISSFIVTSFAYGSVMYVPSAQILMTGSTSDIRFDIHRALADSGALAGEPQLNTASNHFEGAFYMTGIGWGLFQTGSYQVSLNCGVVDFSTFTGSCQITGTGWSEIIGELGFSGVEYNSYLGMLSGSISTFVGPRNISGIFLPLKPAILTVDIDSSLARHDFTLMISGSLGYGVDSNWTIEAKPTKDPFAPQTTVGSTQGVFTGVDLSIADTYDLTITDPSGSTTTTVVHIFPNTLSLVLETDSYYLQTYCSTHPTPSLDICPDGTTVSFTTHTQSGTNLVADGQSFYDLSLRGRDKYGNAIGTGKVLIEYTTTVKAIQIDSVGSFTTPPIEGDAIIHSGGMINWPDGTSTLEVDMLGQDVYYSIASVAPTGTTENIIQLKEINYTDANGDITPITGLPPTILEFAPWFTVTTTNPINEIQTSEDHAFAVKVEPNSARVIVPGIYTIINIGNNLLGAFRDFTSTMGEVCQAYPQDTDLYAGECTAPLMPSVLRVASATSFTFTGIYAPMTRYPIQEEVVSENAVTYNVLGQYGLIDVLYHAGGTSHGTSLLRDPRIKILGTNNALGEYGNISLGGNGKAKFFDTVRKAVTLLSRNRTTYDAVDYLVVQGDYTLTGGSYDAKRTIIVMSGNVIISDNINEKDTPHALIALSGLNGYGGIVTIADIVRDMHLTVITDKHIESSGDKQLYVHGSLISSNTLGDTVARICPYYVTPCGAAEAELYDLENLRKDFTELPDTTLYRSLSPRASGYPNTSLIVEQDPRIISNPPPGL